MARHYYLTRSGRLRRKDNTIYFEPGPVSESRLDGRLRRWARHRVANLDGSVTGDADRPGSRGGD
ncbi:MAG: hypothetical protein ACREDR_21710 [Blastocatellia bacterium]